MKKIYFNFLSAAGISLIAAQMCNAQAPTPGALALKAPAGAVTIDGKAQEWGDSLSYYNTEKKIHYTLANDKTNIYLVVKATDPIQQKDILTSGVTFSLDSKGRKKSAFSTTFPSATTGGPSFAIREEGEETMQQKALKATMTMLKKIAVSGFRDIDEDAIGTTNTYGIKVAMAYDEKGALVYEETIPLALFHADDLMKNEWSFNLKINGIEKTGGSGADAAGGGDSGGGGGGGRRGGGGGGRRASSSSASVKDESTPSIDFWGKFTLAK